MNFSLPVAMNTRPYLTLFGGRWLDYVVLAMAGYAVAATLLLNVRPLAALNGPAGVAASLATGLTLCALTYFSRSRIRNALNHAVTRAEALPIGVILAIGLALRLLWNVLFHAQPASDGATYVRLAQQLAAGGPYEAAGTRAYWPVGYPAYLAAWFRLLGDSRGVLLTSNLVLYLVAAVGVYLGGKNLAGARAGKTAALLFACWPNLIAMTATPEKEMLVTALLPWAFFWLLQILDGKAVSWRALASGLLLGYCILVQPSFQFLPLLAGVLILGYGSIRPRSIAAVMLLIAGAALVILPWSLRNYAIFDQFVLVSTNGGDNLYRANNPLATGGYTPRGEIDLSSLGEIEKDHEGKRLAGQWIAGHPAAFMALLVEKQIRFLGDDATGIYNTFKAGGAAHTPLFYLALKASANAWWIAFWLVFAAAATQNRESASMVPQTGRLPAWLWLYLFTLHSVFESTGKYHVPALWALCVLFAVLAATVRRTTKP